MADGEEERNIQCVQALYAATGAGDWATAETMLTDDFFVTEADTLPMRGVYSGRKGLQQLYTKVMALAQVKSLEIRQITAGGNYAVVLLDLVLEGTPEARASIAEVFHFREGKVCEIKPYYFDPTPMIAAAARKN